VTKPLALTTRTHPLALVLYGLHPVLGVCFLTGAAQASSLTSLADPAYARAWAVCMLVFGAVALWGCFSRLVVRGLERELAGAAGLVGVDLLYVGSLLYGFGLAVLATELVFTAMIAGLAARGFQIRHDRRRAIGAATADQLTPVVADPEADAPRR